MINDSSVLLISIQLTIAFFCAFSIIFLSHVDWRKNRWLVMVFFSIGWPVFNYMTGPVGFAFTPHSTILQNPSTLILVFPSLYFYSSELIKPGEPRDISKVWYHLTPFLVLYILFLIIGLTRPFQASNFTGILFFLFLVTNVLSALFYTYLILKLIRYNQDKVESEYSNTDILTRMKWMQWLAVIMALMTIIGSMFSFLNLESAALIKILITLTSLLLSCSVLGFYSFRQPALYPEENPTEDDFHLSEEDLLYNDKWNISKSEIKSYMLRIEKFIQEKKPYLNPSLRMPELAEDLNIPRYLFSFLINEGFGTNFYKFINSYRIEHAKKLLTDQENENLTIEAISEMSGFKTKTTFNSRFKEFTGETPSMYKLRKFG